MTLIFRRYSLNILNYQDLLLHCAHHGKHGLEQFQKYHCDLCILDVMMPVMDGFTLAGEIRKLDPGMPIIFLTAKNQKEDKLKGL